MPQERAHQARNNRRVPTAPGFAVGIFVLTVAVVLLAIVSQRSLTPDPDGGAVIGEDTPVGIGQLYLNVVFSQLLVAGGVFVLVWASAVPWRALGTVVDADLLVTVLLGIALGIGLYLANEASVLVFDRLGIGYSDALRGALAPSSIGGWALLLIVVLPVIAGVEELLFRAALIGGLEASLGISPWILVVLSAVFFAVGHGIQGMGGVLVTGTLGLILGLAFVLTNSLLLVIVAHYVVNALEFVIHEALDITWPDLDPARPQG